MTKSLRENRRNNDHLLHRAESELWDHFARFGGGNRPFNMCDFEVPLYICISLLSKQSVDFDLERYQDQDFIDAGKGTIEKVNEFLDSITLNKMECLSFILRYYFDSQIRLSNSKPPRRWLEFGGSLMSIWMEQNNLSVSDYQY